MNTGEKIKNFQAEMTGKTDFKLSDYKGHNIIIYFYPRDNTPGCTSEGEDFRDNFKKFKNKKTKIFDVIKEKSMYGKKYMGIERSTFLIDSKGKLIRAWRKVKVKGHVEEVLSSID